MSYAFPYSQVLHKQHGLLVLLGDAGEEAVSGEEGEDTEQGQVAHHLEHVQLHPEVDVQHENGAKPNVESCRKKIY